MPARVAVYVHDLRATGVVRNAISIAERLARDFSTTLVAGQRRGLMADIPAGQGLRTVTLFDRPPLGGRAGAALALRRFLMRERPAVLLSAGNYGHPTVWLSARGLREAPARIYRISNEVGRAGRLQTALRTRRLAWLIQDAARIAIVGDAVGRARLLTEAVATGRAVVIRNGVDAAAVRAQTVATSPHAWFADDIPVVIGIGRLHPQKNLALLVEAFARVRATRPLRLVILGGGAFAERDALLALAASLGVSADMLLAGETDNVFPWLARAAVFALPSRWEGSSVALLEALAVGVPVVACQSAGDAATVLDGGRYGVLSADDPDAFAAALVRQLGPDAILPGARAADYPLRRTLDTYADLVAAVAAEQTTEAELRLKNR